MRVLVCGGRNFSRFNRGEARLVIEHLNRLSDERGPLTIIEGGAPGVDSTAHAWARTWGAGCETYRAEWTKHGRAAGPKRNQRMIDEGKPDLVVAFPGGRGTADMVRRARAAGIEVIEVGGT